MAEIRSEAQRQGAYNSESAVTSSSTTPTFPPFRFNPEAKPFIQGALSHPPTPIRRKSAESTNISPTGSILDPTAPTFYPSSDPLYFSPGTCPHPQQYRLDAQDSSINHFDEVGSLHPGNYGPGNGFDQNLNYGFNPGFIHPLNSGYVYTPAHFAAPGTQPIYATAPEHVYERPGYGGGKRKNNKKSKRGWKYGGRGAVQQQASDPTTEW